MMFWIATLSLVSGLVLWYARRNTRPIPPGPSGLPLLGSALDLPAKFIFQKFDEWSKQYTDGWFMFSAAGQKFLVVTRKDVAAEILEKMSVQTADRPMPPMAVYMVRHMLFSLEGYGDRWRRCRRVTHETFNIRALSNYRNLYEVEVKHLIKSLVNIDPMLLGKQLTQFSGSLVLQAMYGAGMGGDSGEKEKNIHRVWEMVEALGDAMSPATFLINLIPALGILPEGVSKWKQFGSRYYEEGKEFFMGMAEPGLSGKSQSGFVASCARMRDKTEGISDEEIAWTSFAIYGAGVETTPYTLHWFILAMILHPEVLEKAQAEIDAVVGEGRPTFEDRPRLPYLNAVLKETLRWRTVLPVGLPHMAAENFQYKQYVIEKGTYIFGSQWNLCRDPIVYPNPDEFQPERYYGPTPVPDPPVFGFGRRVCPGKEFALNALFLAMANLLWAFNIHAAKDEHGVDLRPSTTDFDGNILVHPRPFPCVIQPRRDIVV